MTAETVYTVANELSEKERNRLYNMLKQDYKIELPKSKRVKKLEFTDADALKYLYENLF